jgi:hypothetical protein
LKRKDAEIAAIASNLGPSNGDAVGAGCSNSTAIGMASSQDDGRTEINNSPVTGDALVLLHSSKLRTRVEEPTVLNGGNLGVPDSGYHGWLPF